MRLNLFRFGFKTNDRQKGRLDVCLHLLRHCLTVLPSFLRSNVYLLLQKITHSENALDLIAIRFHTSTMLAHKKIYYLSPIMTSLARLDILKYTFPLLCQQYHPETTWRWLLMNFGNTYFLRLLVHPMTLFERALTSDPSSDWRTPPLTSTLVKLAFRWIAMRKGPVSLSGHAIAR